ncbi:RNA polymerase sigma factor [Streptomyces pactum]|uniref:RNA polymerase sigma factor n=1 Tax=Streptomyces pactum TaxID=68249 RepID=UPI0037018159
MPEQALDELVSGALNGDQESWNRIVERYSPLIWAIAKGHRLSPADCGDVSQATWLRVVQHLDRLRSPDRLAQWISTAARRESLNHLARSKRHIPVGPAEVLDQAQDADDQPEHMALARERDDEVLTAFCALPARCQALLSLLVAEPPMPYSEVSAALDMPRGSIGPVRRRCLAHLERLMKKQGRVSRSDAALAARIRAAGIQVFATPEGERVRQLS